MLFLIRILALACVALALVCPVAASELKIEATLIWGTNDEKSPDPKLKGVDEETTKKLRTVFKWKYYFEVNRARAVIPSRGSNKVTVSKDCVVEITELEGPKVSYRLIGKGNPVTSTVASLAKDEPLIIGGEAKGGTAWFVIIRLLD